MTKKIEKKYISVPFEIKATSEDDEYFYFEGYASTFGNVDLGDDIIERGAFSQSLKSIMPKLLWQHKMNEPLGIFEEVREDDRGLFVRGKMPKADTFVNGRVIPQMKIGAVDSMSIGYQTIVSEYDSETNIRKIKEVVLYEASLVTIPMNPQAVITGMKAIEEEIEDLITLKDINNYLKLYGLSKTQTEGVMAKMRNIIKEGKPDIDESKSQDVDESNSQEINDVLSSISNNLDNVNKNIKEGEY